jgi:hypothetical protein
MEKFAPAITPVIVCPASEVSRYAAKSMRYERRVMACPLDGIGPTRQWIIENSPTRGVIMVDDDMYFSKRTAEGAGHLERVTNMMPIFEWISNQLDAGFAHGGVSARQGNQNIPRPQADCIRVNNVHFIDRDVFMGEQLRFDRLPVMEDFDVELGLLTRGYPNRVLYNYCWSQRGSGTKGGCSLYRTKELQAQAALALNNLYPEFVKIVEKNAESGGSVFSGTRIDVNIQWLKAWAARDESKRLHTNYIPAIPELARR